MLHNRLAPNIRVTSTIRICYSSQRCSSLSYDLQLNYSIKTCLRHRRNRSRCHHKTFNPTRLILVLTSLKFKLLKCHSTHRTCLRELISMVNSNQWVPIKWLSPTQTYHLNKMNLFSKDKDTQMNGSNNRICQTMVILESTVCIVPHSINSGTMDRLCHLVISFTNLEDSSKLPLHGGRMGNKWDSNGHKHNKEIKRCQHTNRLCSGSNNRCQRAS